MDDNRTRIFFVNMRNFMMEAKNDGPIHARNKVIAQQDIEILSDLYTLRTPISNTKEVLMPADKAVVGYLVHCGLAHRNYTRVVDVGNATNATISGLEYGQTYYFSVTAYTSNRVESRFSNEASSFIKWPRSRLTVITNNFGTVFPDLNGSNLVVGRSAILQL